MSTLIFDFDGTLADTFYIAVNVFRRLGKGRRDTSEAAVQHLRSLPARQVLAYLRVPWWFVPYVAYHGRKAVRLELAEERVKAIAGIEPVLHQLREEGHRLLIVSTNSSKNIAHFLKNNKLEQYFDQVHGGIGLFDKARALSTIMHNHNLSPQDCYYIGDEVRDIDAARRIGMPCISVAWGYNSREALKAAHATTIIEQPKDLLRAITGTP